MTNKNKKIKVVKREKRIHVLFRRHVFRAVGREPTAAAAAASELCRAESARRRTSKREDDRRGIHRREIAEQVISMNMVEIQQRGIEFLRRFQKVGTSYRALGLAETSSWTVVIAQCTSFLSICICSTRICKSSILRDLLLIGLNHAICKFFAEEKKTPATYFFNETEDQRKYPSLSVFVSIKIYSSLWKRAYYTFLNYVFCLNTFISIVKVV